MRQQSVHYYLGAPAGPYHSGVRTIRLSNGADISYTVYDESDAPFLQVLVPFTFNPFDTAYLFGDYLCVGCGDWISFIDLECGRIQRTDMDLYFGYFYEYNGRLYVASAERVYCFNAAGDLVWRSGSLAVDGVVIQEIKDSRIYVSCELDPPGGWIDRVIDLNDGREI